MTEITRELLESRGFTKSNSGDFVKQIGPTWIGLGNPRNTPCVFLRFDHLDGTVMTHAETMEDIESLERLLGDACIDHDFEEFVDEEAWDEMTSEQ